MKPTKATMMTLALCALGALQACGNDDGDAPPVPGTNSMPAPGTATPPAPDAPSMPSPEPRPGSVSASQAPAYLAATHVFAPDGPVLSYFQLLSSIDAGSTLDIAQAVQAPGAIKLFALPDRSWFAIGDAESPTLTRYVIGADGALQREPSSISLEPSGVSSFVSDQLYVASSSKVYYPDPDGGKLVILDPQAMAVRGTVALPQTLRDGYTAYYAEDVVERDGQLLFSVGWFDEANDQILAETGLVVIDTQTDTVVRFDVDARCGGIKRPVAVASGDTYFVSSAIAASAFRLGRYALAPCALRIRAGEDHFDPLYSQQLSALGGGAIVGEPVPASGAAMFLRVLDPARVEVTRATTSFGLASEPAWGWLRWDVGLNQVTPVPALQRSAAAGPWFEVDGRVFGTQSSDDYETTTLIELSAEGGPRPALTSPGILSGVARVR